MEEGAWSRLVTGTRCCRHSLTRTLLQLRPTVVLVTVASSARPQRTRCFLLGESGVYRVPQSTRGAGLRGSARSRRETKFTTIVSLIIQNRNRSLACAPAESSHLFLSSRHGEARVNTSTPYSHTSLCVPQRPADQVLGARQTLASLASALWLRDPPPPRPNHLAGRDHEMTSGATAVP